MDKGGFYLFAVICMVSLSLQGCQLMQVQQRLIRAEINTIEKGTP